MCLESDLNSAATHQAVSLVVANPHKFAARCNNLTCAEDLPGTYEQRPGTLLVPPASCCLGHNTEEPVPCPPAPLQAAVLCNVLSITCRLLGFVQKDHRSPSSIKAPPFASANKQQVCTAVVCASVFTPRCSMPPRCGVEAERQQYSINSCSDKLLHTCDNRQGIPQRIDAAMLAVGERHGCPWRADFAVSERAPFAGVAVFFCELNTVAVAILCSVAAGTHLQRDTRDTIGINRHVIARSKPPEPSQAGLATSTSACNICTLLSAASI